MSLRKGSLEEYYNSGPVANLVCGKPKEPGPRTCYQDLVEPRMLDRLALYANPQDSPKQA